MKRMTVFVLLATLLVLAFAAAMVIVTRADSSEFIAIRCQSYPSIEQLPSGVWRISCPGHVEANPDNGTYPSPGEDPGPYPMPTETPGCIRAWDGGPCYPDR